jgi:hypothetical protein
MPHAVISANARVWRCPHNSCIRNMFQCKRWGLIRGVQSRGSTLMNGLTALFKGLVWMDLFSSATWRYSTSSLQRTWQGAILEPDVKLAGTLISDFPVPRTVRESISVLYKLPSLGYSVIAIQNGLRQPCYICKKTYIKRRIWLVVHTNEC